MIGFDHLKESHMNLREQRISSFNFKYRGPHISIELFFTLHQTGQNSSIDKFASVPQLFSCLRNHFAMNALFVLGIALMFIRF
jgi:hypothetical protein